MAPEREPEPEVQPDIDAMLEEAISRSVDAYQRALEFYRAGEIEDAREWLDRSLSALLDVDPVLQGDPTLEAHYRDLMDNVHELLSHWPEKHSESSQDVESGSPVDALGQVDAESAPQPRVDAITGEVVYDIPIEINGRVQTFLDLYQGQWREQFARGYRRSGRYMDMILRVLEEEGMPLDLAYIPHVESLFKARALSRVRAYGLWQFMAGTGRSYGLRIDYWVDERANPEKATRAAARYLKMLYGMFGDWNLAMASYNAGEYKVQRGLRRSGVDNFWSLARTRYLRRETKNFVPAIQAAIIIYRDPAKYGFDPDDREPPWDFERIDVDGPVDLMVLAECAGTDLRSLRALNPELRRNTVYPEGSSYSLRVPPGRAQATLARLAEIPPGQRIRQVEHVMRQGETLSLLASKYGTSVRAIQTANEIRDPRRVRAGSRLIIPLTDGMYAARWLTSTEKDAEGRKVYTVRRGDNPYRIARRHKLSLDRLLQWNGMTKRSVIHPGDRLYLQPVGSAAPAAVARAARVPAARPASQPRSAYVVRRGDTLSRIAWRQGVNLEDLLAWNGLHVRSVIRPGDRLMLRSAPGSPVPSLESTRGPGDSEYVVRRGDTLYDIARDQGVPVDVLLAANGLHKRSVIHPGQRLTLAAEVSQVPGGANVVVYVVKKGDTLYDISLAHSVSVTELCRWNGISRRAVLHPGDRLTLHSR